MFTKDGKWVKTSPWGNYLTDSVTKEADRQRDIGKNGNRTNNAKHKKPRMVLSSNFTKVPFYKYLPK